MYLYVLCFMSIKNKILFTSLIICSCFWCISFWDNSDCWIFAIAPYNNGWFERVKESRWTTTNKYSNFLSIQQQLNIIDTESLNTSLLNLKKYCCENSMWWLSQKSETCKNDKAFFNTNSLDSQYLFDHLFDVIMRRLAGLTGENHIYESSKMTVDDIGSEWRKWINEKAVNLSGSDIQSFIDEHSKFWKETPEYNISNIMDIQFWNLSNYDFLEYVSWDGNTKESENIANVFKNYDKWTLFDRYNNACALTEYFYILLSPAGWTPSSDKTNTIKRIANWYCNKAKNTQILSENYYIGLVAKRSSNLFLENHIQWYVEYLYDRSNKLKDTWQKATDRFLDVIRAVPKLVKSCVK